MPDQILEGLIGVEYQYYRDDPGNWRARLEALKEAGIETVSLYIPWVHHEPEEGIVDFTGTTKPTRDVVGYLELVRELGMKAIVKPGPFIHSETRNGGYPDSMVVDKNPNLEARLDNEGNSITWKWGRDESGEVYRPVLPTPLGEEASARITKWLTNVRTDVVDEFRDIILGLQLFNEWFGSDHEHVIEHTDYSISAQVLFKEYLHSKYGKKLDVSAPADFKVENLDDLRLRLDWADFSTRYYMQELYHRFNVFEDIPIISNPKAPGLDKRDFKASDGLLKEIPDERHQRKYDTWLAKVSQIPKWNLIYAPTNWPGVLSDDPEARLVYELTIKFNGSKAICTEDNWGFARLYDPRFESARVVLWQTLFGLANGMQGSVVYTGVQTHNVDPELDNEFMTSEFPYPASAPITAIGEKTEKYEALKSLTKLLQEHEITIAKPTPQLAWANYGPYAQLAMWNSDDAEWVETFERLGHKPIRAGYKGLDNFARQLNDEGVEYGIVNLETEVLDPEQIPVLALVSGFYMDRETQKKLLDYADNGGKLILYGELPIMDEKLEPLEMSKLSAAARHNKNVYHSTNNPFEKEFSIDFLEQLSQLGITSRCHSTNPEFYVRELVHPDGTRYSFVMSTSTEEQRGKVSIGNDVLDVALGPRVAEVYSIKDGTINKLFTTANFS